MDKSLLINQIKELETKMATTSELANCDLAIVRAELSAKKDRTATWRSVIREFISSRWRAFEQGLNDGAEIHRRVQRSKDEALELQVRHGIPPHRFL